MIIEKIKIDTLVLSPQFKTPDYLSEKKPKIRHMVRGFLLYFQGETQVSVGSGAYIEVDIPKRLCKKGKRRERRRERLLQEGRDKVKRQLLIISKYLEEIKDGTIRDLVVKDMEVVPGVSFKSRLKPTEKDIHEAGSMGGDGRVPADQPSDVAGPVRFQKGQKSQKNARPIRGDRS